MIINIMREVFHCVYSGLSFNDHRQYFDCNLARLEFSTLISMPDKGLRLLL